MMQIPLRRRDGTVRAYALVDDADYEELSRWRWSLNEKGYAKRSERQPDGSIVTIRMHRQIMGFPPLVDHIDGNRLNNQRSNLRSATRTINGFNRQQRARNNTSGFTGAFRDRSGRWIARVRVGGHLHYLGTYDTADEAGFVAAMFRAAA